MEKDAFRLEGRVEEVLISCTRGSSVSTAVPKIKVIQGYGVREDRHAGVRFADARDRAFLRFGLHKGTEVANFRQFSLVSQEELALIADRLGLPDPIPYGCLGENIVISGIPRLTALPPGTMLFFRRSEQSIRTAVLAIWGENEPCPAPGNAIQVVFPELPAIASKFARVALGRRGVIGSVYCSGVIKKGDTVIVEVPPQRIYSDCL